MGKQESDQNILRLLCKMYLDIFDFGKSYEIPDGQFTLMNFAGRGMKSILESEEKQKLNQLKRLPGFSPEDLSKLVITMLLHCFRIARYVNQIRVESGKQPIDWYPRVIEEDQNEPQ